MLQRFKIWSAFLGGAVAWTLHLFGAYAISEGFCRTDPTPSQSSLSLMLWSLIMLTLLALALTLGALWLARRQQLASLASISGLHDEALIFMSRSSVLSNSLFLVVIIAQSIPIILLGTNC